MKKTLLYDAHIALGAKMLPFGGYDMPIQYSGIIKEHGATRTAVTIFDTCHMGEFRFSGKSAVADLDRLVSCRVADLGVGQCRYGFLCNEAGGVIDDQIIYRLAEDEFMMVVNAGTQENDFLWIMQHISASTTLVNESAVTAKMDIQGPQSPRLMRSLLDKPIDGLKYFHHQANSFRGNPVLISRTGYTGEIGFEIYLADNLAIEFWKGCIQAGALPAGLGARDTLRLEIGMPLYGHELSEMRNAAESGLLRSIDQSKEFIGAQAVRNPANHQQTLVGILLEGRRAARAGDGVLSHDGKQVGMVTSGSFAPTLNRAVALAYIDKWVSVEQTLLRIKSGVTEIAGTVSALPLYTGGTARKKLSDYL